MVTPPEIEARSLRLHHAEKGRTDTIAQQLHVHYSVVGRYWPRPVAAAWSAAAQVADRPLLAFIRQTLGRPSRR